MSMFQLSLRLRFEPESQCFPQEGGDKILKLKRNTSWALGIRTAYSHLIQTRHSTTLQFLPPAVKRVGRSTCRTA